MRKKNTLGEMILQCCFLSFSYKNTFSVLWLRLGDDSLTHYQISCTFHNHIMFSISADRTNVQGKI